jgi:hypothetical protein
MVIMKDINYIKLSILSHCLNILGIEKLNIFCLNNELDNETLNYIYEDKIYDLRYIELNIERFKRFLNSDKNF